MRLLVTGGAGFIGSNFIHYTLSKYKDVSVLNFDKLTYAGNLENLADISSDPRYKFVQGDIADAAAINQAITENRIESIINFAAETHVDRSIHGGNREFVLTNTLGVQTLLDSMRLQNVRTMVQVSTDEVYGSLSLDSNDAFAEDTPLAPNMPYAAAKAGGDMLARAAFKTYGTDVRVTHCSNNYGPYQFPEKLIPFFIFKALRNEPLPLYGDGLNVRDWIYVMDHCAAIDAVLHKGKAGEVYNIGVNNERSNVEIAKIILQELGKPESLLTFVADRPGHDRRYAIDSKKIERELGWQPQYEFERAIKETIKWYQENADWVKKLETKRAEMNAHLS